MNLNDLSPYPAPVERRAAGGRRPFGRIDRLVLIGLALFALIVMTTLTGCAPEPDDAALAARVAAEAQLTQARAAEANAHAGLVDAQSRAEINGAAVKSNAALLSEVTASAETWRNLALALAAFTITSTLIGAVVLALALSRRPAQPTTIYMLPADPRQVVELPSANPPASYSMPRQAWPELAAAERLRQARLLDERR